MRWGAPSAGQPVGSPVPLGAATEWHSGSMASLAPSDLVVGEEIGKGRFKRVVRGTLRCGSSNESRDVVVLQYVKNGEKRELQILAMLAKSPSSNPFVPEIFGTIDEGRTMLVVQERALLGSMKAALTDAEFVPGMTALHKLHASAQLSRAMSFLELNRIVHADLSCRNVLLCNFSKGDPAETIVKVTDFGLAVVLKEGDDIECRKQPQATRWCAPETVAHSKFSHRSDVWSLGTTLWELFSDGEVPWVRWQKRSNVGARLRALVDAAAKGVFEDIAEDFPASPSCSSAAHRAILSCLRVDERARPGFAQLVEDFEHIVGECENDAAGQRDGGSDAADGDAAASCGTTGVPSEATTPREGQLALTNGKSRKAGRPDCSATPSTSATPTVPWWQTEHLEAPAELLTGPKAAAFAEALREFLHSPRVLELLGDKAGLEALKEFLCSPHALELLATETDTAREDHLVGFVRERTPQLECREDTLAPEVSCAERARGRRRSSIYSRPAVASAPLYDSLVPLSPAGVPADYACPHARHCGVWTLLSLVSPALLRRQDFLGEADAWAAFRACSGPCMLRDPRGVDAASRSWVVLGSQLAPGIATRDAIALLSPSA